MQQFLKASSGTAWTRIIATELLDQLFAAMNDLAASFHMLLRGEALPPFVHRLEKNGVSSKVVWLPIQHLHSAA
jgi:hypothetical protein